MPGSTRSIVFLLTAQALLTAGCGGARPGGTPSPSGTRACVVVPPTSDRATDAQHRGGPDGEIVVALRDPVDPADAPSPRNASERLVFRQLYETLVRVDCDGRVRPGLATSWSHDGSGRRWTFELRPDARFWDGTPVTAWAVARGWASATSPGGVLGDSRLIDSVSVLGEGRIGVVLVRPTTAATTFAGYALAVAGSGAYAGWALGSGPYRPVVDEEGHAGEIRVTPNPGRGVGTIVFRTGVSDARSALDAGADVLVSSDPQVLAYARALPNFTTVPLPWSRTYVVAARYRGDEAASPSSPIPADTLARLAHGAVQADARPATPPFWWRDGRCPSDDARSGRPDGSVTPGAHSIPGPSRRIVYPQGDAVARGIAERLVGLAGLGSSRPSWLAEAMPGLDASPEPPVAAALPRAFLARAAGDGQTLALVIPVPRAPAGACLDVSLAGGVAVDLLYSATSAMRVTPLVDVRSSLVVRTGVGDIGVDGEGTLVFHPRAPGR